MVLTEDSGADGLGTVREVTRLAARLAVPGLQTQKISWKPASERAARANLWKSKHSGAYKARVDLARRIANHLAGNDFALVVYHFDGDRTWGDRDSSENARRFSEIETAVVQLLQGALPDPEAACSTRLIRCVPYYSIEAWLFQNTEEAATELSRRGRTAELARLQEWASDRAALDEVMAPKKQLSLGNTHNLALACRRYPAQEVHDARKSFFEFVQALRGCAPMFQATRADQTAKE